MPSTDTTVDISSKEFWEQPMRERDVAFARLRDLPGLSFHRPIEMGASESSPGFWAVVRHDDIQYVSRHAALFCSGKGVGFNDIPAEYNEPFGSFLMTDAPRHTQLRGLISRAFTPRRVRAIEDQIHSRAEILVRDAVEAGSGDLVEMLSAPLPLWTISEMVGVPEERRQEMWDAANALVSAQNPDGSAGEDDPLAAALMSAITLSTLGSEIAAQRRDEPRDDLLTSLVQAEVDGERLDDQEIGAFMVLLGVAGNDTTRNTITHGVLAFAQNPDQWELLRSDPETYMPGAVEELVRWASPVLTFRRTVTEDTTIGEQPVAEGDHVVMFYASGNRDERNFADPWQFDITRSPNDHVAFGGGGPHYCLGANLARAQLRSVFGELARNVRSFQVGEPELLTSAFVHGVDSLPVTFVTDDA